MIKFLKRENGQLGEERAYYIQMLGASTRLVEVVNRYIKELKQRVLEFKETQSRLNEEYYSII